MSKFRPAGETVMKRVEDKNWTRVLFGEAPERYTSSLLPFQQGVLELAKELRAKIQAAKREDRLTEEQYDEAIFELQSAYYAGQQGLREEAEAKLQALRAQYEKGRDPAAVLLAMTRARNRAEAMSADALQAEIESSVKRMEAGETVEPEAFETLLAVGSKKCPEEIMAGANAAARRLRFDAPWTHGEEGRGLVRLQELCAAPFGMARMLGELGQEDVPIEALLQGDESR